MKIRIFAENLMKKFEKKIEKILQRKFLKKYIFLIESDLTTAIYAQNNLNTVAPVGA